MDRPQVADLVKAVMNAGGRLSLEDGKPVLIAKRPLPTVLTEELLARRAELIELLNGSDTEADGAPILS